MKDTIEVWNLSVRDNILPNNLLSWSVCTWFFKPPVAKTSISLSRSGSSIISAPLCFLKSVAAFRLALARSFLAGFFVASFGFFGFGVFPFFLPLPSAEMATIDSDNSLSSLLAETSTNTVRIKPLHQSEIIPRGYFSSAKLSRGNVCLIFFLHYDFFWILENHKTKFLYVTFALSAESARGPDWIVVWLVWVFSSVEQWGNFERCQVQNIEICSEDD